MGAILHHRVLLISLAQVSLRSSMALLVVESNSIKSMEYLAQTSLAPSTHSLIQPTMSAYHQ